ncbi:MAG: hydroxymethylglutaryl-CoA reductase, degradative [Euryarchaeota archaeon]|nr:hydroxymethylglutaryl-CoA reductase, degradative [Euryarchaeota archaeon]
MSKTSAVDGFYKKTAIERLGIIRDFAGLNDDEARLLGNYGALDPALANRMVENVVGTLPVPMGYATNFLVNGRELFVPMATEEPSVIAAASNAAKLARAGGGFRASTTQPVMIGQIQITGVRNPHAARFEVLAHKQEIIERANAMDPMLVKFGGGARDVEARILESHTGQLVVVHLLVDTRDAMGANAVNTMAEAVAPYLEELTRGKVYLRIISNLAVHRLARATAVWKKEELGGEEIVDGIIKAWAFAAADPYRCATHNKGIMNGIDAVVLATGNDYRAIEAGAHAYAAITGKYQPLTRYEKSDGGDLVGTLEMPMAVGIIGGASAVHPVAKLNIRILGITKAHELAEVIASVGLAQNFAALRALSTEGIQRGHMSLHAKNVAVMAGAMPEEVDRIVEIMVKEKKVRIDRAKELLDEMRRK